MAGDPIGRRTALKYLGFITGSATGWEFLSNWLSRDSDALAFSAPAGLVNPIGTSQASAPTAPYSPRFFTPDQFSTIEILTEMIIPTDSQPGAKEAKVAEYIDFVVYSASKFEPSLQGLWVDGLAKLDSECKEKYGQPFSRIAVFNREALLTATSLPERDPKAEHPGFAFYHALKEMTVEAFYSSKIGLINVLGYEGLNVVSNFSGCS